MILTRRFLDEKDSLAEKESYDRNPIEECNYECPPERSVCLNANALLKALHVRRAN